MKTETAGPQRERCCTLNDVSGERASLGVTWHVSINESVEFDDIWHMPHDLFSSGHEIGKTGGNYL